MTSATTCPTVNWTYPTQVRFGPGRLKELPEACKSAGIARPLIVTDPGLARLPMIDRVRELLAAAGLEAALFSDLRPNPVYRNVEDGMRAFRAGGHDGVVAIGGGSGLDTGKAIAFQVGQRRPIWDFEDIGDWWTRADPDSIAPVVAIPTTAGTGSEVGRAAVITNEETHRKYIIFHPRMMPRVVISDPELSTGLPPRITAATGMDALAHNLEAYCAPSYHPIAEGVALEGIRLIKEWLPVAYRDGKNLVARGNMLAAASMGAAAFQKGLGAIHAMSHPVGALYDAHHGLTNAVVMPYVLARNRPAIEEKTARIARYLGLVQGSFIALLDWVMELRRELGIPHTLAELGVEEARIPELARMAAEDPNNGGNPVPLTAADYEPLFLNAIRGRLS
ncbi:MAG TPA: iron-containing alcohol dehydrogenase [Alphaproteobacteria bacterium]|nr:iron-containing alcohol dehydrogenase [Alphaproteobacteria bacterium]